MADLAPGDFLYNGIRASTRGMLIQFRPNIPLPKRRVDFMSSGGRVGDIPFDRNSYENTDLELHIAYKPNRMADDMTTIAKARADIFRFFDSGTYMRFQPYFDNMKIWMVMPSPDWEGELENLYWYNGVLIFKLKLTCQPYKLFEPSINQTLTSTTPTSQVRSALPTGYTASGAWPVVTVEGRGTITITIGGRTHRVNNVEGNITIDTWNMWIYTTSGTTKRDAYEKAGFKDYFSPSVSITTITASASAASGSSVTKITVEPGWRALV